MPSKSLFYSTMLTTTAGHKTQLLAENGFKTIAQARKIFQKPDEEIYELLLLFHNQAIEKRYNDEIERMSFPDWDDLDELPNSRHWRDTGPDWYNEEEDAEEENVILGPIDIEPMVPPDYNEEETAEWNMMSEEAKKDRLDRDYGVDLGGANTPWGFIEEKRIWAELPDAFVKVYENINQKFLIYDNQYKFTYPDEIKEMLNRGVPDALFLHRAWKIMSRERNKYTAIKHKVRITIANNDDENITISTKFLEEYISFALFYNLITNIYKNRFWVRAKFWFNIRVFPEGGGSVVVPEFLKRKGIDLIINDDDLCGQRCLVLATSNESTRKNLKKPDRAVQFAGKAKYMGETIDVTGKMSFLDFDKFSEQFKRQVIILGKFWVELYSTAYFSEEEKIYLYYDDTVPGGHYHYISNINMATNDTHSQYKWCSHCNKSLPIRTFQQHKCRETVCDICKSDFVTVEEVCKHFACGGNWIKCGQCNVLCPGDVCHDKHVTQCKGTKKKCNKCKKYVDCRDREFSEHICGEELCLNCGSFHSEGDAHRCFIKCLVRQPYKKAEYWVFDFESLMDEGNLHVTSMAIVSRLDVCYAGEHDSDEEEAQNILIGSGRGEEEKVVFKGENTMEQFATWCLGKSKGKSRITIIAHNGKAYDTWLLHKYLIKHTAKRPESLILAGNKIMSMKIGNLKFLDSLNHVAQALETFPKTFGIKEMKKGFFPYDFNTRANQNYIGVIPDAKYYKPDEMKPEKRSEFLAWYAQQGDVVWDFQKELFAYCESDVDILKRSMEIYMRDAVTLNKLNPLECPTIASYALKVYRTNHMPSDQIAILKKKEYDFCKRGFYGGRTEVFRMVTKFTPEQVEAGTYAEYKDIQSLYPTVQFYDWLPSGIPEWKEGSDVTEFGYHEVDITPPKNLHIPVLPERKNFKLIFDLTPKEKCVYSSLELEKAVELGYVVTKVHRSLVFEKTRDLFKSYIRTFLKIKAECSGYDGKDIDEYIERYNAKTGVLLEKTKIKANKGMKLIAKILLNSLWGKFGQRDDLQATKYLTPKEWFKLFKREYDGEIQLTNETLIDEDTIYVSYIEKDETKTSLVTTNVGLAGFVTANARLRLYSELEKVGERAIYCDTDSIIYTRDPDGYNIPSGDCLGEWEPETETPITEVLALAPKSYAYTCVDPKEGDIKCKGITLHFKNLAKYSRESMRKLIAGELETIQTTKMEFKKDCKKGTITTKNDVIKVISANRVESKRLFSKDGSTSKPREA
jgi:DNA polymerase type B, organellar and viral